MDDFVTALRSPITDDPKVIETKKAWDCWRAMRSDCGDSHLDGRYENSMSANENSFERSLSLNLPRKYQNLHLRTFASSLALA
jgi:hypothetical protein